MNNIKNRFFDVIIPVGPKDVKFAPRVVEYVWRCLLEAERIFVITNKDNFKYLGRKFSKDIPVILIDENELIDGLSFKSVKKLLNDYAPVNKNIPVGWYLQQFIKFAFAKSKYAKKYYLSWDADTLPLAHITFFDGDNLLFNPKSEYNVNYFNTIKKILGYERVVDYSFISENMLFSVEYVKQMLNEIENRTSGNKNWIESIISSCDFKSPLPAFSEFETYGNFCAINHQGAYKPRHLNTFREANYIAGRYISESKLRILSFDLDTASFELKHRPGIPYIWFQQYEETRYKINKLFHMPINEIWDKLYNKLFNKQKSTNAEIEEVICRLPKVDHSRYSKINC